MKTYKEKEKLCEELFADGGDYWHVFTNGRDTPLLFAGPDDFVFVMNVIAQMAEHYFAEIKLITFAVMNNHFHFVISAHGDGSIHSFFDSLKKRLSRSMPQVKPVTLNLKRIPDLKSLRNNIVYVNRNGYVANPDCTPFSYPWGPADTISMTAILAELPTLIFTLTSKGRCSVDGIRNCRQTGLCVTAILCRARTVQ